MNDKPSNPAPRTIYVWPSLGLWNAQASDLRDFDTSEVYTSVDRIDALEQAGYEVESADFNIIDDRPPEAFGSESF